MTGIPNKAHEHGRFRLAGAAALAPVMSLLVSTGSALELDEILEASRVTPPARVDFTEERHSPLFDEALVLAGYLEYLDRGVLNKVIETPFSEAFLIEHGEISLRRDGETRTVSLERSQELATIIGAIEAILSGEATRLETLFEYELSGTQTDWSMELRPRSRRAARNLSSLSISGTSDSVARILIDLQDGEYQVMTILPEAAER